MARRYYVARGGVIRPESEPGPDPVATVTWDSEHVAWRAEAPGCRPLLAPSPWQAASALLARYTLRPFRPEEAP